MRNPGTSRIHGEAPHRHTPPKRRAQSPVAINYQGIGSGGGIKQIMAKTVDFGASDEPLTPAQLGPAGLYQFPAVIGGVTPVVNVPGVGPNQLKLSGPLQDVIHWLVQVQQPELFQAHGMASFDLLQRRLQDERVFLYAFDLIELSGVDRRRDALTDRKADLGRLLANAWVDGNEYDGPAVFRHACANGLEGVVSKRKDSRYMAGRSPYWLKTTNPASPAARRAAPDSDAPR